MAKPRARDLGLDFPGTPGSCNALTDVPGVLVGYTTLIDNDAGPVRTGVTAILPFGHDPVPRPVWAGQFSLNGNGEMTGVHWIHDAGYFLGPVCITNAHSVGIVHHAATRWIIDTYRDAFGDEHVWAMPVVAETYDGVLNDIDGQHVRAAHAIGAIESAAGGQPAEGNVGGGTGMVCHEFKGGIGTSSRRIQVEDAPYVVGVLVQANYGLRDQLRIAGAPIGREISEGRLWSEEQGSIIIVVATDAPLLPHQLKRLARRASLGLARVGSTSGNGSGDIFIAFSTANAEAASSSRRAASVFLSNDQLGPVFDAVVHATEESIVNALVAAETMVGRDGHQVVALPQDRVVELLRKYGRLVAQ